MNEIWDINQLQCTDLIWCWFKQAILTFWDKKRNLNANRIFDDSKELLLICLDVIDQRVPGSFGDVGRMCDGDVLPPNIWNMHSLVCYSSKQTPEISVACHRKVYHFVHTKRVASPAVPRADSFHAVVQACSLTSCSFTIWSRYPRLGDRRLGSDDTVPSCSHSIDQN